MGAQRVRLRPLQAGVSQNARCAFSLLFSFRQRGFSLLPANCNTCSNVTRGPSCRNGVVRTVPNSTDRPGCPRSPPRPHPPAGARSSSSGGCRCPAVPGQNVSPGAANGGRTSGPGARPIGGGGTLARIFTRGVRRIAPWSINLILRRTEEGSLVIKLGGFI